MADAGNTTANSTASPPAAPSGSSTDAGILPAAHWEPLPADDAQGDDDSAYGDVLSSTASLTSSILRYRTLHGRTYHSEIGRAEAWEPNDEKHVEAMDMQHHMCELMLDGKLCLAPLDPQKVKKVVDIGTGTGLWVIDFAEAYPDAEVTGTDVSPIQPSWVPPNVKFELDDANLDWTWKDDTFDFIHARFMSGTISDWAAFYREAFRCIKPGAWIEHQDVSFRWRSDQPGGIPEDSALGQFHKVFWEGGRKFGRTFRVVEDDLQRKGMEEAGFVDLVVKDIKVPLGDWPLDPKQKEVGLFAKASSLSDMEGYLLYMFRTVMGWADDETMVYSAHVRRQIKEPDLHPYFVRRVVYGRKPDES